MNAISRFLSFSHWASPSSTSHKPRALTKHAEAATITAAKMGGTTKSILDFLNISAGRQKISDGTSKGTLTKPSFWSWHTLEKEEDGVMAHTNASSGAKEVTATVAVRMVVQVVAYTSNGHRWVNFSKIEFKQEGIIMFNYEIKTVYVIELICVHNIYIDKWYCRWTNPTTYVICIEVGGRGGSGLTTLTNCLIG